MIKISVVGRLIKSLELRVMLIGKVVVNFVLVCKRERFDKEGNV